MVTGHATATDRFFWTTNRTSVDRSHQRYMLPAPFPRWIDPCEHVLRQLLIQSENIYNMIHKSTLFASLPLANLFRPQEPMERFLESSLVRPAGQHAHQSPPNRLALLTWTRRATPSTARKCPPQSTSTIFHPHPQRWESVRFRSWCNQLQFSVQLTCSHLLKGIHDNSSYRIFRSA